MIRPLTRFIFQMIGVFGFPALLLAQPNNDQCGQAATLPVLNTPFAVSGTTINATQSIPAEQCGTAQSTSAQDVWYKFTATTYMHKVNVTCQSSFFDIVVECRKGSCNGVKIACADNNGTNLLPFLNSETMSLSGLSPGETYLVRVYNYTQANWNSQNGNFEISVETPSPPPANDNCTTATELEVFDQSCQYLLNGTTSNATSQLPALCNAATAPSDVWYRFEARSITHTLTVDGAANMSVAVEVVTVPCNGPTLPPLYDCGTAGPDGIVTLTLDSLFIGQTYFVRVYDNDGGTGDFTICIYDNIVRPANDDCGQASSIAVAATCNNISVATFGATRSEPDDPTCSGNGNNDDVWYTFVSGAAGWYRFTPSSIVPTYNSVSTIGMELYTNTCQIPLPVANSCFANIPGSGALVNLQQSTSYRLRLWTGGANNYATFNFCIESLAAPANDNCAGAENVPISQGTCAAGVAGRTYGATASGQAACTAGAANDDVWYSFTATASSHIVNLLNVSGSSTALTMQVYSGSCAGLNQLLCSTNTTEQVTGLTPGQTYYVRVYTTSTNASDLAFFEICVSTQPFVTFQSLNAVQATTAAVNGNAANAQILRIEVAVTGSTNSLPLTQLNLTTNGSTNPASDIAAARVFFTGTSPGFSTATQFGATVNNPNGAFSVSGNAALTGTSIGTTVNYFWLVYDVACNAIGGNVVDGTLTSATINAMNELPLQGTPSGARSVIALSVFETAAAGNWSSPSTWACGALPPNNADANILIKHNVTVNGNFTAADVTIDPGVTLTIPAAGTLTTGGGAGKSNRDIVANGTLAITGGTANVNGAVTIIGGLTVTGGALNIDPNDGTLLGSAVSTTLALNTSNLVLTGGAINLLDPPYPTNTAVRSITYTVPGTNYSMATPVTIGGGNHTNLSRTGGFSIESIGSTGALEIQSLTVAGGRYTARRHASTNATSNYAAVVRNLTVNAGAEFVAPAATLAITGNLVNNGFVTVVNTTVDKGLVFAGSVSLASGLVFSPSAAGQSISGTGFFKRSTSDPDPTSQANNRISSLSVYHTAGSPGLTLNVPLTVASYLRLESGRVNSTPVNLLTLGTATTSVGTLARNTGWVNGALRRWVGTSTYTTSDQRRLYPVGSATQVELAEVIYIAAPTAGGTLTLQFVPGAPAGGSFLPVPLPESPYEPIASVSPTGAWTTAASGLTGGTYNLRLHAAGFTTLTGNPISPAWYTQTTAIRRGAGQTSAANWALAGTRFITNNPAYAILARNGLTGYNHEYALGAGTVILQNVVAPGDPARAEVTAPDDSAERAAEPATVAVAGCADPCLVKVFPSPASSFATVQFELNVASAVTVRLFDGSGRLASEEYFDAPAGPGETTLSLDRLPSGLYTVLLQTPGGQAVARLVKQ